MDLTDDKVLAKMYASATFLGEPAEGVVRELVDEVRRLRVLLAAADPNTPRVPTLGPWVKEPSSFAHRVRYQRYTSSPVCPVIPVVTVIDYRGPKSLASDTAPGSDPEPWAYTLLGGSDSSGYVATAEEAMAAADIEVVKKGWILP